MAGGRVALTERFAKGATTEGRRSPIFYDDEVIGFGLQVRDNGRKTFTLNDTFETRRPCYFIGDHPAGTVQATSTKASRLALTAACGTPAPESSPSTFGQKRTFCHR
jgi:hypothetical protein